MHQDLAIWCPVVMTNLASPRLFRQRNPYQMAESYKRIQDLKVRIKNCQSQVQGNFVETKVGVAWLCLLEDYRGRSCPIKREEVLKDRVPLRDFDCLNEKYELHYIQDINNFSWDAELEDSLLIIRYELSYRLMGTREQLVFVQASMDQLNMDANVSPKYAQADGLIDAKLEENLKLRRQVHFYETNLSSLRRGIQKAEKDNYTLNMELRTYKAMVEDMRDAIEDKDRIMGRKLDNSPLLSRDVKKNWAAYEPNKLGQRIKNLFINNV